MMLHKDIFLDITQNFITTSTTTSPMRRYARQDNWDNMSQKYLGRAIKSVPSFSHCAQKCAEEKECIQFVYDSGTCLLSGVAIRGTRHPGIEAGWMLDRIPSLIENSEQCKKIHFMP